MLKHLIFTIKMCVLRVVVLFWVILMFHVLAWKYRIYCLHNHSHSITYSILLRAMGAGWPSWLRRLVLGLRCWRPWFESLPNLVAQWEVQRSPGNPSGAIWPKLLRHLMESFLFFLRATGLQPLNNSYSTTLYLLDNVLNNLCAFFLINRIIISSIKISWLS